MLDLLTLVLLPWALIAINRSWILTSPGTSDGWAYFGYFMNLPEYLRAFPGIYNGSRLAWILPGALAHRWLPPMAANYLLHVGVYYVAIFALFFTLRRTVGRRAALLVSIVTGCYSYFLHAVGWHYVDGSGLAYYSLALACLTAAIDARWRWIPLLCAGAAFAGAVHTNVVWGLMSPPLAYFYVVTTRESATGRVLRDWVYALIGSLLLTLILGAASVASGGPFWFFAPSLGHGAGVMTRSKPYQQDAIAWMATARFLVVPILLLLATLYVQVARGARETTLGRLLAIQFVAMCAMLAAADLAGRTLLQNPGYWSFLIPGMALAGGVLLRDVLNGFSPARFAALVAVALAAFLLSLTPIAGYYLAQHIPLLIPSFVALAVAMLWVRLSSTIVAVTVLVLSAAVVNVVAVDGTWEFQQLQRRANKYRATVAADEALRALDPTTSARFWYSEAAPLGDLYQAIASTRLWGYRLFGNRFPSLWNPLTQADASVARGQTLIVLTSEKTAVADADAALQAHGLSATLVAARDVAAGDVRLTLLLLRTDFDRRRLAATPLDVSAEAFLEGSTKLAAARVAVDAEDNLVEITTNRGTYDEQIASRPIPVTAGRRYLVDFEVRVPRGGAGLHVLATRTRAILGSAFWCQPVVDGTSHQLSFETGPNDDSVFVLLTNCGHPEPVTSDFSVRNLRIWPVQVDTRSRLDSGHGTIEDGLGKLHHRTPEWRAMQVHPQRLPHSL